MNINERFRTLRESCGKNQSEWAKILGLSRSGVSEVESGRRNVTEKHIKLLCIEPISGKYISEKWLRTGEGEPFIERPLSEEIGYYVSDLLDYNGHGNAFFDAIIEMMKNYAALDDTSQAVVREYFREVAKGINARQDD